MLQKEGPKRKHSRSGSVEVEDLNYVDEESELSSGDLSSSDLDLSHESAVHIPKKRGRPKVQEFSPPPAISNNNGYISETDETGERKVDKFGRLLGGREYRVPVFNLPTRGETLYMFSKDPAALLGYRDSFVFLKRNPSLVKVHINNVEKGYLVDSRQLRSSFRTREISVVTARSVFKQFGHRVIRKGRKGRDDYFYTEEVNEPEEDIMYGNVSKRFNMMNNNNNNYNIKAAMPTTHINTINTTTNISNPNINTNTASISFSSNNNVQSVATMGKNSLQYEKSTNPTNDLNWIHCAAVTARQFNSSLFSYRQSNPTSYDMLTNVYQISMNKQMFYPER